MTNLLLPYAFNCFGKLMHIDCAHKGEKYTCPSCGAELALRISKIPQGEKYHRINHFAHKRSKDNYCSESFLHKLFKERVADYIRTKIDEKEDAIWFEWECDKCHEQHRGNLIKKATRVIEELDLQICKPDIALLDKDNKVIIAIEVVVTHKPTSEALQYYNDNKIACLQILVESFADCDKIEEKLSTPNYVNRCPNPICNKCGHVMNKAKLVIVATNCWKCGRKMKVAMLVANNGLSKLSPAEFNDREIETATSLGANIKPKYSQTVNELYLANTCEHCNAFVGDFYTHQYYYLPHENEIDLNYKCLNCIDIKNQTKQEKFHKQDEYLFELIENEESKLCPKCGGILKIRIGKLGPFYGCENYPNCRYTENIKQ